MPTLPRTQPKQRIHRFNVRSVSQHYVKQDQRWVAERMNEFGVSISFCLSGLLLHYSNDAKTYDSSLQLSSTILSSSPSLLLLHHWTSHHFLYTFGRTNNVESMSPGCLFQSVRFPRLG